MRTALITTTISVPKVLALYRNLQPVVEFFVAADEKTPLEAYEFCGDIPNCTMYSPEHQKDLGYECSELLGWNNDSRRNIALLEAMKWGADIIVSVDDDMIAQGDFFGQIERLFYAPSFSGLQVGQPEQWVDIGQMTSPPARQRGLPFDQVEVNSFSFVSDVQVGAMQGIILGIPDTDACTMLAKRPVVFSADDVLHNGFVVDPQAYAVFNSQLTVFRRALAPCFAQFYKWQGRNTDIFASLIMRRLMREYGFYTYFGPPVGFHARNPHDSLKDLQAERWGIERVQRFAQFLNACIMPHKEIVNNLRLIYRAMGEDGMQEMAAVALTFLDDMEKVL